MDQQKIQQQVLDAQAKQAELKENILVVKGQRYHDQMVTVACIVQLGRALDAAGYPAASEHLMQPALSSALTAFGVDKATMESLAKDALALAGVCSITVR